MKNVTSKPISCQISRRTRDKFMLQLGTCKQRRCTGVNLGAHSCYSGGAGHPCPPQVQAEAQAHSATVHRAFRCCSLSHSAACPCIPSTVSPRVQQRLADVRAILGSSRSRHRHDVRRCSHCKHHRHVAHCGSINCQREAGQISAQA